MSMQQRMTVEPPWGGLDGAIARAEAACARYREAANEPLTSSRSARVRRSKYQIMEKTLARLQAQKICTDS
jgi:hypothetical protein